MNWNSWQEFWAMGGYGLYVWGSLLVSVFALGAEWLELRWRGKAIVRELSQRREGVQRRAPSPHSDGAAS